jgi:hypothetical protein
LVVGWLAGLFCVYQPYCRLVREALCSLEIPYMLHNVPHGAAEARRYFFERFGDAMAAEAGAFLLASEGKVRYAAGVGKFPWLVDPNTNVSRRSRCISNSALLL